MTSDIHVAVESTFLTWGTATSNTLFKPISTFKSKYPRNRRCILGIVSLTMLAAASIISAIFCVISSTSATPSEAAKVVNNGPVIPGHDFPDVNIQHAEGKWWAFATRNPDTNTNIQVASSDDYKTWQLVKNADGSQFDALPDLPSWTNKTNPGTWGPDVVKLDNGDWIMYWSAHYPARGSAHCNSWAKSKSGSIKGPYIPDMSAQPWLCPPNSNGAFGAAGFKDWQVHGDWSVPDPNGKTVARIGCEKLVNGKCGNSFVDSAWSEGGYGGERYIVVKVQNADGSKGKNTKTPLVLYEVDSQDGITLKGSPVTLLDNDGKADADSIESPTLYKTRKGKYVLFFSRGNTVSPHYTISYAVSNKLTGPYVRKGDILGSGDYGLHSPGAADVSWGGQRMVFAAIPGLKFEGMRVFYAGEIDVDDGTGEVRVVSV